MADQGRCRSCNAEILWAVSSETGKRIPLDKRRTTVYQVNDAGQAVPVKQVHLNHFVTCPNRDQHRKR